MAPTLRLGSLIRPCQRQGLFRLSNATQVALEPQPSAPRGQIRLGAALRRIAPPTLDRRARQQGFGYLWVMTTLVVMGVYLSQIVSVSSVQAQREREAELLRVGLAYQNAIRAYYQDAATASERYPLALTDLVKDPRVPQARRYLRKLYADPLTQSTDWGLIFDPQKRIVGVYSKAVGTPMNQADFSDQYAGFAQQTSYRGWIFKYQPDIGMSGGRR